MTTTSVLSSFRDQQIKAVVFALGSRAERFPDLLQQEWTEGHTIANHTWDHHYLSKLTPQAGRAQIDQGFAGINGALAPLGAEAAPFFRFPGGMESESGLHHLSQLNVASFTWDAGADDWKNISAAASKAIALKEIEANRRRGKGIILLLHDTKPKTAQMLPYLLKELARQCYRSVQLTFPTPKNQ